MNPGFPRSIALTLAILVTAAYPAAAGTPHNNQDARLTVSVTVPPICTVQVAEGESTADEAVVLECRNLPDQHPEPQIEDAEPARSDDVTDTDESVAMVVINF